MQKLVIFYIITWVMLVKEVFSSDGEQFSEVWYSELKHEGFFFFRIIDAKSNIVIVRACEQTFQFSAVVLKEKIIKNLQKEN